MLKPYHEPEKGARLHGGGSAMQGKPGRPSDPAYRRKAQRSGAERGYWVYIPAESLRKSEVVENGLGLYYKVWASPGGSVLVRFYPEP